MKKKTGIFPTRDRDYPNWYQEVIKNAELAEHSTVRGCMIIKPFGYELWENMRDVLDSFIKKTGHKNVYFPLFIPLRYFEKEAKHVQGFAKECAVVTHHRLEKEGDRLVPKGELEEPYIVRPTSEMIVGEAFSRWIESYRDLPILINQWANIVRWEMRIRMFLRTSEILWQEGHTAHRDEKEAMQEVLKMLDVYADFMENYLAIPVIKGKKTESEKFPGAEETFCVEAMMQDKKALQAGTSHFLGQNFAKASNITFRDEDQKEKYVFTTSWGVSTRLIGALIMAHGDDDGMVLPPKIANIHVVIEPVGPYNEKVINYGTVLLEKLQEKGIKVLLDKRDIRGGEKKWGWIKKGIPLRVEIGRKEIEKEEVSYFRRDDAHSLKKVKKEDFVRDIEKLLEDIQKSLFFKARKRLLDNTKKIEDKNHFYKFFKNSSGFAECYFCCEKKLEEEIKKDLGVTVRCILQKMDTGDCIFTKKAFCKKVIFAKAY